jgi:predicted kinase
VQAVLLIGIQGAGKTTFYSQQFASTHLHISLDIAGTREQESALVKDAVASGKAFVVDNTNARKPERAPYIQLARAAGYRVTGYFFKPDLRASIGRNNYRTDKKPLVAPAVIATFKRLEPPRMEEGFDELLTVEAGPERSFVVTAY